uniref:Ig-like domain-containing protein n=1 Tax=Salvator merianae TaxID=96440 RepID=A0A8D0DKD2_SALMN
SCWQGSHEFPGDTPVLRGGWKTLYFQKVQPLVTITPMDHSTTSHNILLICNVGGFFPPKIAMKWFKNGEEEKGSHVSSTDLIRNGDWTFQTEVMLETQPERGDVCTCQVDHASFKEPVTVQWGFLLHSYESPDHPQRSLLLECCV